MSKRMLLVTSALPYANGSIHIGHLVEYIQTDIWVRFQRLCGNQCYYVCADDTHGTPIMLAARRAGITPQELVNKMHKEHQHDFARFYISFDNYYTTNSQENRYFAELIFKRLKAAGHVVEKEIEQAYCDQCGIFLPDRFIRGTCPVCEAQDQYGDACEICSSTYNPTDLKDARCSECGNTPTVKKSVHLFFRLSNFEKQLKQWTGQGHVQIEIKNKLEEWFRTGLQDWDISRDAPYFGFEIPGYRNKYFYVWLDAPIGYIASTKNWCDKTGADFSQFWEKHGRAEIVHFIGKDIVYFHTLFWPAMLMGAGLKTPHRVHVHGFLTVNGQKMAKSRGTFITASDYLNFLDPEYLRYYYACKLTSKVDDIDLNLEDFVARVNADLGHNFVNLGSRAISFLTKRLEGKLGILEDNGLEIVAHVENSAGSVAQDYESLEYGRAVKRIMELSRKLNGFLQDSAPWQTIKTNPDRARNVLTAAVNGFAKLSIMLKPILPKLTEKIDKMLDLQSPTWQHISVRLENRSISPFKRLFSRLEPESIQALIKASAKFDEDKTVRTKERKGEKMNYITFEQFMKIDLRVAKVLNVEKIEGSNKLLKLKVDLGPMGTREILAGLAKTHNPSDLIGKNIAVVANLQPRKMKFGVSEGMLLAAATEDDSQIDLVVLEGSPAPGTRIS